MIKIVTRTFTFLLGLLLVFNLCSCSKLFFGIAPGYIQRYDFGVSKKIIHSDFSRFIAENSKYSVPADSLDMYFMHFDPTKEMYFYFRDKPNEIYSIEFGGGLTYWQSHPETSVIYIVGVAKPGKAFRNYDGFKLWFKGKKRIRKRFETEILQHLNYSYSKGSHEQ